MFIKHNQLSITRNKLLPVLILLGDEPFQCQRIIAYFKKQWLAAKGALDGIDIIDIETDADWSLLEEKVHRYHLFSDHILIDARYNKKSLEAKGRAFLTGYLAAINPHCTLIIQAPHLSATALKAFQPHQAIEIMLVSPPSKNTIIQWINQRLMQLSIPYDKTIPELLWEYTENNLVATDQALEKIALFAYQQTEISLKAVQALVMYQCQYSPYELSDTCLNGQSLKAIQLLSDCMHNKTEPSLLLWVLAQDIRLLIQIQQASIKGDPDSTLFNRLKIWSSRIYLYKAARSRCSPALLVQLLNACHLCDLSIKSAHSDRIWHLLDAIALSLCTGSPVGYLE